jgi:hypothetical protein
MKRMVSWAFWITVVACSSSGGTETDNPASLLRAFDSSECKTREAGDGAQGLTLASEVEGLMCVEWERQEAGSLTVRLLNFSQACANEYLGRAAHGTDGTLELAVYADSCTGLKCGDCLFDFTYELAGIAADVALPVRLGHARCESEPTTYTHELTLPLDEEDSGIVCKLVEQSALEHYAQGSASCGSLNMPCGDCVTDEATCEAGLTCAEVAAGDARCLARCQSDADCPADLACQNDVCIAKAAW